MKHLVALSAAVLLLATCSAGTATLAPSSAAPSVAIATASPTPTVSASAAAAPTTAPTPRGKFTSANYGYSLTTPDWLGTDATTPWDGTGAPGDGDPFVDTLVSPDGARVFATGVATAATLAAFEDAARKVNTTVHNCPLKAKTTTKTKVGGQDAIVDTDDCGVFATSATIVHDGRANVFFTYGGLADEAAITEYFQSLLKIVSFD
jgi:hypothetical protein